MHLARLVLWFRIVMVEVLSDWRLYSVPEWHLLDFLSLSLFVIPLMCCGFVRLCRS